VQNVVDLVVVRFDARTEPVATQGLLLSRRQWARRLPERVNHVTGRLVRLVDESRQQRLLRDVRSRPEADLRLELFQLGVEVRVWVVTRGSTDIR